MRNSRYQGAIVRDHHILLIKHRFHDTGREYWLLPGGGLEAGESETDCVQREMREETDLEVRVEDLLFTEEAYPGDETYQSYKTFLCVPMNSEARPGYEPEADAAALYSITAVQWVDLRAEAEWEETIQRDMFIYPQLKKLQTLLITHDD